MREFFTFSGFETQQNLWLIAGFLFFLISLFFYIKQKQKWAVSLLTISGLALFVFAALSDPFLNPWDERFHALVAKNCMEHPFRPMLFKDLPLAEINSNDWSYTHIWLHKQPLFLWQIALSFKLFGVSEFTLRLPSVIMATLMIPMLYRIGKMLLDEKLGYFAALSVTFSWFLLDLVSGHGLVDHNNVCFAFYVSASIWAWMEYIRSGRKIGWMAVAAVFSGCAVLTKWLTGLLVYLVWGVYLIATYRFRLKEWKLWHYALAVAITAAVFLPWQIYCAKTFPQEWKAEQDYNRLHLTTAVEKQNHNTLYYIKTLPYRYIGDKYFVQTRDEDLIFGGKRSLHLFLIVGGFLLLLFEIKKNNRRITLLTSVLFVYIFFTIAATKMPAYTFCACVAGYLSLGILLWKAEQMVQKLIHNKHVKNAILVPFFVLAALYQFNFSLYRHFHNDTGNELRQSCVHNKAVYLSIKSQLPEKSVVFNVRGNGEGNLHCNTVDATFYTGSTCFALLPTEQELKMLKHKGYHIAVLTSHEIPAYMMQDAEVQKIDAEIWGDN